MKTDHDNHPAGVGRAVAFDIEAPGRRKAVFWLIAVALVAGALAGITLLSPERGAQIRYVTAQAHTGDLTVVVTATGELKPLNQVEVGTEVSGTIETVAVDFNDRVKHGQILAKLDTEQLEAKQRQSEAALALAQAQVKEAEATLTETRNKLARIRRLVQKALTSKEDLDVAEAAYDRAVAALASRRAQVDEKRAQLDADRRVLEKAVIRAPIDGIVLMRQVEPGQTVAASLQTPVLFTLAENLTQMELHVAIDEADVGQVVEGQRATFTVDAYPDRTFEAVITQVRFAPQTIDGVVTYQSVLSVDNADLSLRPGMTATADIPVKRVDDALLVANTALRFTPPSNGEQGTETGGSVLSKLFPRPSARKSATAPIHNTGGSREQRVWVLRDGKPVAVPVTVGATDGTLTEVVAGDIAPGTPIVVDTVGATR